jgi:hypothetical protein
LTKKLYVGNLPFNTTEADLREVFEQHGTVESVNVITDRETGRPRGFAFIEMEAVATSGWTKRTIAAEAEVEVAGAEAAVALGGGATATSDYDLRGLAGDPDRTNGLGRSGQPKRNRAEM